MKNRYRSKVVEIDAFRFQREAYPGWFADAMNARKIRIGIAPIVPVGPVALAVSAPPAMADTRPAALIDTLEGTMTALPGDWIIRVTEGEFYPCKDSVFQRKYEPVGGA